MPRPHTACEWPPAWSAPAARERRRAGQFWGSIALAPGIFAGTIFAIHFVEALAR